MASAAARAFFTRLASLAASRESQLVRLALLYVPAWILAKEHVLDLVSIHGPSMRPLFNEDGDWTLVRDKVITWKWRAGGNLERGMVVTVWSPLHPDTMAVKRIVGLPGDVIVPRRGAAAAHAPAPAAIGNRNHHHHHHSHHHSAIVPAASAAFPTTVTVPPGHLWIEGSGPAGTSLDSNTYGPVARQLVVGRVAWVVYPWRKFGPLRWWEWEGR